MAARREVTKQFARAYGRAGKAEKGEILDALVASTGWTRDHAHRAISAANTRRGAARDHQRKPRPRKYSYDALIVLQEVWRLTGQPSGKYLAAVMDDILEQLVRFRELGTVQPRVTDTVLDEVLTLSGRGSGDAVAMPFFEGVLFNAMAARRRWSARTPISWIRWGWSALQGGIMQQPTGPAPLRQPPAVDGTPRRRSDHPHQPGQHLTHHPNPAPTSRNFPRDPGIPAHRSHLRETVTPIRHNHTKTVVLKPSQRPNPT